VRNGFVPVDSAARDYGVAVDPDTFDVDVTATERLRSSAP
jgi:N-methylhydantoinase B